MKLSKKIAQIALVLAALPVAALAGDNGTVYTQFGSNGLGIGYAASVAPDWAARGQFNTFKQSFSGDVGDYGAGSSMTVDLSLSSVQLVGDWYPTDGGFRVSGGVVFNNNKITVNGTNATVGTATGQTVSAEIKMSDTLSPYVGIGYSTRPKDAKGFGFNFDVGVMFQKPSVTLTASGGATQAEDGHGFEFVDGVLHLSGLRIDVGLGVSYAF